MTAGDSAAALLAADPIWCDPPMVDLLAAAADTYPAEAMQPHHLLAPDGIVIFARPLPVVWAGDSDDVSTQQLCAMSWSEGRSTSDGQPLLGITGWERATGLAQFTNPRFVVRYTGMRPVANAIGPYGAEPLDPSLMQPYRLVQTLTALCRTPLVVDESAPASQASRGQAIRAGRADPAIRRIRLRRPEHAAQELDAARDARYGRPPRGHWVRGHWKNQWHASIGEHRMTWIAGYPRGDFTAGTVEGTKMLIACDRPRLPQPE